MKLGKLRIVENKERSGRSSAHYHHALVITSSGLETLIMTDRELESIRSRALKNSEDIEEPGILDRFFSWVFSLLG